ncbi:MAG: adenylate/guanylate cyclase domain-containing protein [Planctomycetota bacterium]
MDDAAEIDSLRALIELRNETDSLVEESLRDRLPLEDALERILPALCAATGAKGAWVHTFDEDLSARTFVSPSDLQIPNLPAILARTSEKTRENVSDEKGGTLVVSQPLDVAGEWFGSAGLVIDAASGNPARLQTLLQGFCEEIDNFLSSIRTAREKHKLSMGIGRALRAPVFLEGLAEGVQILRRSMDIAKLLIVYTTDEPALTGAAGGPRVELQCYEEGQLKVCTLSRKRDSDPEDLVRQAASYLYEGDKSVATRLGFDEVPHEEILMTLGASSRVIGKVLASSKRGNFNTYDRELLAGFAGSILDRITDFHKEWRTLARMFRPADVLRLLQTPGYERLLVPHEQTIAMVFADIAGFTRISEQVLVTPTRIFGLVDTWGTKAVECVWAEGGVFDKMIGDCVVGLFGPPFYETPPGERLAAAIRAALRIRQMTKELPQRGGFDVLKSSGLGVAIGVNLAPAMVGRFGPNDNFTAFASGMNNSARLQSLATRDEILVMSDSVSSLPPGSFKFGDERNAPVKNVAQPLRFRALVD